MNRTPWATQDVYFQHSLNTIVWTPAIQSMVKTFFILIFMMISQNIPSARLAVGKYLVSPLAKPQGEGRYVASVSIRSGKGSATHDRVMRFSGLFDSAALALQYATEQALGWIKERNVPACA